MPHAPSLRRAWLLAAAALVVTLAVVFRAGLLGAGTHDGTARMVYYDAMYRLEQPFTVSYDNSSERLYKPWDLATFRSGELPLWQPLNGFGTPVLGNGQSGVLNPLRWLFLTGTGGAWTDAYLMGRLYVAGLGALALSFTLGLSPLAGFLAALAFMLHGFFLAHLTMYDVPPYAALPWLLVAAERLRRAPTPRRTAVLGGLIGLTGVLGHPEPAIFGVACTVGIYALGVAGAPGRRARILAMAAALALGVGTSLLGVVPFLEFVRESRSYLFDRSQTFPGIGLKQVVIFTLGHLVTPTGANQHFNPYVGIVPLLLAPLGLAHRAARLPGLALVVVGVAATVLLPPFGPLGHLPFAPNSFYAPPLIALGLALLAGAGLDGLGPRSRRWLIGLAAAFVVLLGAFQLGHVKAFGRLEVAIGVAAAGCGLALALRARPRWLAGALCALATADLLHAADLVQPPLPALGYPETPVVRYLQGRPGPYRIASGETALVPNVNAAYGIASLELLEAFHLKRYAAYMDALNTTPHRRTMNTDGLAAGYRPDLLDLANVRFLLVPTGSERGAWLRRTVTAAPATWSRVAGQPEVDVYENARVLPRARVLHRARFVAQGSPDAAKLLAATPAAWREAALVETPDGLAPAGWRDAQLPPSPVEVVATTDLAVALKTTLAAPGWLVLADAWYPGWVATVDGKPADIHPADVAFRAVHLDEGTHDVRFDYRPRSVAWGAAGTGLALVIVLLMALPRRRAQWREGSAP